MFDTFPPTDLNAAPEFETEAMVAVLSFLDDDELARVEDDLNFFHFSGCPTPRLAALFRKASATQAAA